MKKKIYTLLFLLIFSINFLIPSFATATTPTLNLSLFSENQNSQTGKWSWNIIAETTNVPNNTSVYFYLYEIKIVNGKTISNKIDEKTEKTENNKASYLTGSILFSNNAYRVTAIILPSTSKSFSKTTPSGITPEIIVPGDENIIIGGGTEEDNPVVTVETEGQQTTTNTDDTYNLLAPIPGLEEAASTNDIGKYFNIIFEIVIGICAVLAVVMIVIGGIEYMGDESVFSKTEAKSRIKKALLGLIIVLGAYALLNTINPDLLGGGGVNIRQVTAEIEDGNQYRLLMTQNTPEAKTFKRTSYYGQIKTIATNKGIPHCLVQVAIQRESGGKPSIGHDEDVPVSAIPSRRSFVASGKKFDGTTFSTTGQNDKKITQKSFKNTDHPNNYLLPPNQNANDLGLDWRFSHSVGLFGVTFGPNHLAPSGAKNIFTNSSADVQKATEMMKTFYNKCNKNIEETWRAYNSGRCDGNNSFTNKEAPIRVNLYNQCVSQDN